MGVVNEADNVIDAAKLTLKEARKNDSLLAKSVGSYEIKFNNGYNYAGKGGFGRVDWYGKVLVGNMLKCAWDERRVIFQATEAKAHNTYISKQLYSSCGTVNLQRDLLGSFNKYLCYLKMDFQINCFLNL